MYKGKQKPMSKGTGKPLKTPKQSKPAKNYLPQNKGGSKKPDIKDH